ncbi:MAG: biopolymer transporter ExbD [Muribaculaceae bacterium]|nr:biopolymer transporter ExbD [Bacteroidales bacterium]MDE6437961.1 biopolymer transporter ExbD [Muribaculaceae bacterium]
MALKRQQDMMATFSMASMTDVVFLLLVFFMVTSAFVFPTALEIDLPTSSQQTPVKPQTRVFIDSEGAYYVSSPEAEEPMAVPADSLAQYILATAPADSLGAVAVYADAEVAYGKVVEVLNLGAANSIKMVLATKPASPDTEGAPAPESPAVEE